MDWRDWTNASNERTMLGMPSLIFELDPWNGDSLGAPLASTFLVGITCAHIVRISLLDKY